MHTNKSQSRAHQPQVPLTLTQNAGEGNRHNNMPTNHPQSTPLLAMPISSKVPPPYTQNFSTPPPSIPGNNSVGSSVNNPRNIHSINNSNITHGMGPSLPQGNHPYVYPPGIHGQQGQTPHPQPVSGNIYQQNPPPTQGIMTMPGFVNNPQGGPPFMGGPIPQGIQMPPPIVGYYSPMIQSNMSGPVPGDGYNYNPQQHHVIPPPQMVSIVPGSSNQQPNIHGGLPSSSQGIYHQRNSGNSFRNNQKAPHIPPIYGHPGNFYSMPMNMMMPNNSGPQHVIPTQINQPPIVPEVKEKTKIFVQKNKDGVYLYGQMTSTGLVFSKEPPKEMVQENEPPEQEVIDNYQCPPHPNGLEPSTSGGLVQVNSFNSCPNGSIEDYAYSETDSVNVPSDPRQISHTPVEITEEQGRISNENCVNSTEASINSLSNMLKQSGIQGMDWSTIVEEEKKNEVSDSSIYKENESCSSQETITNNEYIITVIGDDPKKIKKLTKGLLDEIFMKNKIKHDGIKTTSGELITNEKQFESIYLVYFKNKNSMIKALNLNERVESYIKLNIKLKGTNQQNISNDNNIVKEQTEGYKNQIIDNRSGVYQDVRLSREYQGSNRYGNYKNNDNNYQKKQGGHYYDNHSKNGNFNKDNNFKGIQQRSSNHGNYYNKNNYNQRHSMPNSGGTHSGDKMNNQQFEFYNNHRNNHIKQSHSGPMKSETASVTSHYSSNSSLFGSSRCDNSHDKVKNNTATVEDTVLDIWCKERREKNAAAEAFNKTKNEQNTTRISEEKISQSKTEECSVEKEVLDEKILEDKKNIYYKDNFRRNYHSLKSGNHYTKKDNYHKYSGSQSARFQHNNTQKQTHQNNSSNEQDDTLPPTGNNSNLNNQGNKNNFKSNTLPRRISQHHDNNSDFKKRENSANVRTFINSNTKGNYNKGQEKKHDFIKNQNKRNNSQSSNSRNVHEGKVENKSIEDLKFIATDVSQPLSAASSPPSLTEMILPLNEKKSQDDMGSALSVSSVKSFKSTSSRPPRIQTNIKYNEAISPQMVSPADSNIDDYFSASENADELRNKIETEKCNNISNIVKETNVAKPSPTKRNRNTKKKEKKNDKNCPTEALLSKNRFAVLTKD